MLTFGGPVRYVVFFVMKLKTRTVEIAGVACQPNEAWMTQVARNLTDARDGFPYHEERPHQGLGNELVAPKTTLTGTATVRCRERLGSVLKFYHREAA